MHRLTIVILAAVDAAIAVAVGLAATLAPATVLWVFGFGDSADWGALWPASAVIWQFGNLVPLALAIPGDYLAVAGVDPAAASFGLSLAPLAFAAFTAIFAARSGARASQADAWITGVLSGSATFAALCAGIALTSASEVASVELWQAILFPTLVFAVPALVAAVVTEWCDAGSGAIARLRDRVERSPHGWGAVPGLVARGASVTVVGLVGLGALLIAVALVLRGGEVIALYEAAHLDALGATIVTLAQLAYLPTVVVWALAFIAGPGFALGEGTSVSPAGTQVGVIPGIPILGIVPESTTPWLLLLALCPVALGAFAGWIARSRLITERGPVGPRPSEPDADGALEPSPEQAAAMASGEPLGARLVAALGIAVIAAAAAALLAAVASGSIGPGSLAVMGPEPGPIALAVGLEVVVGAGILLLSPRARARSARPVKPAAVTSAVASDPATPIGTAAGEDDAPDAAAAETADGEDRAEVPAAPPREPFTFPTLPRIPGGGHDRGEEPGKPPVD